MSANPSASLHRTAVLDSFMTHREIGAGTPMVFLHGNPTSSYVWRKTLPPLCERHRCLAPDLIGMGHSGKPECAYGYADHMRYLDAWFEAMDLRDVVLVGYDWGGVLAIDWASRHPERVRGVVVFETILQSMQWADYPPQGAELFRALRTPGAGEKLVLEENGFLAKSLGNGVKSGLSEQDRAEYDAPFPDPRSRRPMLQWTRSLPIDGEPAEVMAVIARNNEWLASTKTPKLLLTFEGNSLSSAPRVVEWAKTIPNLEVEPLGPAGHHAPEDAPREIAHAIRGWLDRKGSTSAAALLADRLEIADLFARLACLLDERRYDDADTVYTDDVEIHSPRAQIRGIDGVVAFLRQARVDGEHTQHINTDLRVNVAGDQAAASANGLVYFFRRGQPPHQAGGLRLVGTAARTPAGWRLRELRMSLAWMREG